MNSLLRRIKPPSKVTFVQGRLKDMDINELISHTSFCRLDIQPEEIEGQDALQIGLDVARRCEDVNMPDKAMFITFNYREEDPELIYIPACLLFAYGFIAGGGQRFTHEWVDPVDFSLTHAQTGVSVVIRMGFLESLTVQACAVGLIPRPPSFYLPPFRTVTEGQAELNAIMAPFLARNNLS